MDVAFSAPACPTVVFTAGIQQDRRLSRAARPLPSLPPAAFYEGPFDLNRLDIIRPYGRVLRHGIHGSD